MSMNLTELADVLKDVNSQTVNYAAKSINLAVTVRNWVFGYYIKEYELNGKDRAKYGEKVIASLAELLDSMGVKGSSTRQLHICRQFYITYPSIVQTASAQLEKVLSKSLSYEIAQTASAQSDSPKNLAVSADKLLN